MNADLTKLSRKLNYTFKNIDYLKLALTHRSASKKNNERLEFLGDSILNFTIAKLIFQKFAKSNEGELSRLRAHLVNEKTLCEIAKTLDIGQVIQLGVGELKSGGHQRASILADCLEAIFAAVYLDGGIEQSEKLIGELYQERLDQIDNLDALKDAKSQLQEYLQGQKHPLPEYELVEEIGDAHNRTFVVRCKSDIFGQSVEAKGSSRRRAEQAAAKKLLKLIKNA